MKKILMSFAVLTFVACSGGNKDGDSEENKGDVVSKIEAEMGITMCDCMPGEQPDYSNKEERKAFKLHIDSCMALQKEVMDKVGRSGYTKAQQECK